ncbi:MAG: FAD-dependent oxidoreductase [Oscillatoriales cyanobacterium SM2_1_8]|nr:FAD-dependent oxidoreductase [Oscillatoriales cyanobacterium SM2_1_8]
MAALAGGGLALNGCAAPVRSRVAVIGAGLAGLNAAFQLQKQGLAPTVYEGRSRVGGRVYTRSQVWGNATYLDLGAVLINSDHEEVKTLCQELGVPLYERQGSPDLENTAFFFDNRRIPIAEMGAALAPIASQLAADAALLEQDFERHGSALDRLSATAYLDRHREKIEKPFVRSLLQAAMRSEYGSELADLSVLGLLYLLPTVEQGQVEVISQSDEAYAIVGGSGRLAEALAAQLTNPIQFQKTLKTLAPEGKAYRLTFADGTAETVDAAIVTLPPPALRQVEMGVPLPPTLQRYFQEIQLGRNEKQFGRFRQRVWREAGGFGDACWSDRGFCTGWDDSVRVGAPKARSRFSTAAAKWRP